MPNERAVELVHRQIDGEIAPADARELQELRRSDEEIDAYFLDMCDVCEAIDSIRLAEPPPRFAEMVAMRVRGESGAMPAPLPFPPATARRRMHLTVAAAIAAAIVLLFLAPLLMRRNDTSNMSGTMTPPVTAPMDLIDQAAIAAEPVTGTVRLEGRGNDVWVATELGAQGEGQITVEYDPLALRLMPGRGLEPAERGEGKAAITMRAPPWSGALVGFVRLTGAETNVEVTVAGEGVREIVVLRLPPSDE